MSMYFQLKTTGRENVANILDTLWWTKIAMENHHAINGKIHYKSPFSLAMLVHQRVMTNDIAL